MAIFDPREQRLCVRVVYDGVAGAGKTTNLQQLAAMFAAQKATEVYSPAELYGRTLYFDWMQLPAGVVAGIPLLCQVISVPGQLVLGPRRRHLLEAADVIIYVCDSSESGLERAREGLELVERIAAERGGHVPLVVQANKQDQRDAVDGRRVLAALGREGLPVIEAMAKDGVGVVDTFVSAVRGLSRSMQATAEREGLWLEVRRADTRDAVHARLEAQAIDPEWAAELLLEEASAALRLGELEALTPPEHLLERAPVDPGSVALPCADVPTGCIWPAHTGRSILSSLDAAGALASRPRVGDDGAIVHRAGGYVMQSSIDSRFGSSEDARAALVRHARQRTQLEGLLPRDSVVLLQESEDGAWWLWSLRPEIPTLESELRSLDPEADDPRELLEAYGAALVDAIRTSTRHGFGLDLRPEAFGVQDGALRYLGEPLPSQGPEALASTIVEGVVALGRHGVDIDVVLEAFEGERRRRLTREELEQAPPLEHPTFSRLRAAPKLPAPARRVASRVGPAEP